MAEIFFYHLDQQPLELILPDLVRRGLERGIRMVIETVNPDNLSRLSEILWKVEDVAFLAHGFGEDAPHRQPLWLCAGKENPNCAAYRFYVDGAMPESLDGLQRALIMFEAMSEDVLARARNEWKKRKAEGHAISYWKQDENGKWQNLA